jgi:hypothetical protein
MPQNPIRYETSDEEECINGKYFCTTQKEEESIS